LQEVKRIRDNQYEKDLTIDNLKQELIRIKEDYKSALCNSLNITPLSTNDNPLVAGMKFFTISMAERYTTEEWTDIIKFTNLTLQQLQHLSKEPVYGAIIDSLELMNRAVLDKNMHIQILKLENENLNKKNTTLIEENIILSKKIMQQKLDQTKDQISTYLHTNASMVLTINIEY
jgi:hypothetical protein